MEASLLFEAPRVGDLYGKRYSLDSPEVTLGRDSTMDIQVQSPFLDVSGEHCILYRQNGSLLLMDCSKMGTFLNGERAISRVYIHLRHGDRLTFGDHLQAKVIIRKGLLGKLKSFFD
jgi:predicted component of type VI protein secretion system